MNMLIETLFMVLVWLVCLGICAVTLAVLIFGILVLTS